MMRTHYDSIYLSPHLDDAALSCGGQIVEQTAVGQSVLIVTLMAGDPPPRPLSAFAQSLHTRWELAADVAAARRAEDVRACQILGADFVHWAVPDCVYRTRADDERPLYPTWPDAIGPIHPAEDALIAELARQMGELPGGSQIYAPLAVGNHVDHQITRAAAARCFGQRLIFYEDYPYVLNEAAFTAVIPPRSPDWCAQVIPLSATAVSAKIKAITAFTSQLSTFFTDEADLAQKIHDFTASVGGERVWRQTAV
ncbi:MAG: PIG-L family deacetylase [Anaerolineales bacterium]|nr:PIG-L family deacetylase [Anaerolineales bacterium]